MDHTRIRKWELNRKLCNGIDNVELTIKKTIEEKDHLNSQLEAAFKHSTSGIIILEARNNDIVLSNPAVTHICDPARRFKMECKRAEKSDVQVYNEDGTPYTHEELPLMRSIKNGEIIRNDELRILNSQLVINGYLLTPLPFMLLI